MDIRTDEWLTGWPDDWMTFHVSVSDRYRSASASTIGRDNTYAPPFHPAGPPSARSCSRMCQVSIVGRRYPALEERSGRGARPGTRASYQGAACRLFALSKLS
ncbi:hypothetical protein EVAR_49370_1 [Eumeta japonica]|uniref:Uncharacterized protein n=1 Tax=Eumeta variegata TaxID=151549 RepID=A0A4C1XZ53_EUMVA|nr:hypothetical protein EVAR_49370_1 [Eumeta japonica]